MSDSKPPSGTGAVCSLENSDARQTTAFENEKLDRPSFGTGTYSLLANWLDTSHRHERIGVGLSLSALGVKGTCISTAEKPVGKEVKKGQ